MQAKLMVDAEVLTVCADGWDEDADRLTDQAEAPGIEATVLAARLAGALAKRECAAEARRRQGIQQELATPHRQGE